MFGAVECSNVFLIFSAFLFPDLEDRGSSGSWGNGSRSSKVGLSWFCFSLTQSYVKEKKNHILPNQILYLKLIISYL